MGLLDKITGKKEAPKKSSKSTKGGKEENVLDMVKEAPNKESKTAVALKENTGRAHRVLLTHHLSEKTNSFSSMGRYVFKVAKTANKIEVKKAVETVYDVHVTRINMINTPGKSRRMGRTVGRTADWKKAVVTLKTGEKIAGLAEGV